MGGPFVVRIDRKSSIETEPRTLSTQQIDFAREAALCVLNTKGIEEAFRIFSEGLKPVVSIAKQSNSTMNEVSCSAMMVDDDCDEEYEDLSWDRQFRPLKFRDVSTAPF